ncbi:MAG: MBOAT family protein [Clostridia bacterium]|nr:MBOAT family protein [Clostridia bacterium]
MLFNSFAFLIFFPIVTLLYYIIPHKFRWIMLLIASYYFYMSWNPSLVFLIMGTTVLSYGAGLIIEKSSRKPLRLTAAIVAVAGSLIVLFFFKYFNFLSASVSGALRKIGLPASDFSLNVLLPVGISFYTFQTLSYVIDVYKGRIKAERHFGYYALFVSFFPQLVAGPIERPENLLPQLKEKRNFQADNIRIGLKFMIVGFFKKVVIADTVAIAVNAVYNDPAQASGLGVALATALFAVQILCDFDGYTNIAIGVAKLMGIDLMQNFDNPYSARNIKEFWGRWHISLSTWFRDYVYIPLGGNRCKKSRHLFNLFLTFLLSGLWHGANWTFVVWGALHGVYQIVGILTSNVRKKAREKIKLENSPILPLWQRAVTFALVCFAWLFFRANSISDSGILLKKLFSDWSFSFTYVQQTLQSMQIDGALFLFMLLGIGVLFAVSKDISRLELSRKGKQLYVSDGETGIIKYALLTVAVVLVWTYLASQTGYENNFIYFQF